MKKYCLDYALARLQRMTEKAGAEINISPNGISLWTSDASDYQCHDVTPEEALSAIRAIRKFRKYWKLQ